MLAINDFVVDFHIDLRSKVPHEDEIGEGEIRVVEEVVERTDEVQLFGQILVQSLVPVGRRTGHADEVVERFVEVIGKRQC